MLYKETISLILHNVQANRKGALTLKEFTLLNPWLALLQGSSSTSQASLAPPKTLYNCFWKRKVKEIKDNKDNVTNSSNKKVNLRLAISSLLKELACNKYAKEIYKLNQKQAIKLLEKEYKEQLEISAFLRAIALFKDKGNVVTFFTLDNVEYRDL